MALAKQAPKGKKNIHKIQKCILTNPGDMERCHPSGKDTMKRAWSFKGDIISNVALLITIHPDVTCSALSHAAEKQ